MPYIPPGRRDRFDEVHHALSNATPSVAGDLNYLVTVMCNEFIAMRGGVSYENVNAAIGALECAKLELYRRIAAPHEDKKVVENGDVYTVKP